MIYDNQLKELRVYRDLERRICLKSTPLFARLVVASENDVLPVHRWFRFKEAYSADLLPTLMAVHQPAKKRCSLLEPYCGVGTGLLAAQMHRDPVNAVGIEYNPFIRFVASVKTRWFLIDPTKLERLALELIDVRPAGTTRIPPLSSLTTGRCMSTFIARRLLAIRDAIRSDGHSPTHQALLLGLAAAIEPLSHTRKDGRALRLVNRQRPAVSKILLEKWQSIADDVRQLRRSHRKLNDVRIIGGDGRCPLKCGIEPGSIDLIVTSPPYLNNIDYSEVYKLELWLMDFVDSAETFLQLRKGTLRSHPTSDLVESDKQFLQQISSSSTLRCSFGPLLSKLDTSDEKWRRRLFISYFADMASALRQYRAVLRKGGHVFIAIGNSLHGGRYAPYVVASDLLIAELARCSGFVVENISIARSLKRRLSGNHFLRESVVGLRKTDG